jgi:hypothetical protein
VAETHHALNAERRNVRASELNGMLDPDLGIGEVRCVQLQQGEQGRLAAAIFHCGWRQRND